MFHHVLCLEHNLCICDAHINITQREAFQICNTIFHAGDARTILV